MTMIDNSQHHFFLFSKSLRSVIDRYGHLPEEDVTEMQKNQVEKLASLEQQWRDALVAHPLGESIYKLFLDEFSILEARPFFRERQDAFVERVSRYIREKDWEALQTCHPNWRFISWVLSKNQWGAKSKIRQLAEEIRQARTELVEMNLPLAIARARIFWTRTPPSHMSFMDLIQAAAEGLLAAVDKFVLPYTKVWRSVAIGRMVGNFIEQYSQTLIHFYPSDRRRLYRVNKFLSKKVDECVSVDDVAAFVNIGPYATSSEEIVQLMAVSSMQTLDTKPKKNDKDGSHAQLPSPLEDRPDERVEHAQLCLKLAQAIPLLSVFEQKILKMMGVTVDNLTGIA